MTPERLRKSLVSSLVLLPALALWACHSEQTQITIDQATVLISDDSKAWKKTVDAHTDPVPALLYMSWFPATRSESFVEIHADGHGSSGVIRDGVGMFSLMPIDLSSDELSEVTDQIHHLPSWSKPVTQGAVVLVSYELNSEWHTRGYDRAALPAQIQRLFELTHSSVDLRPSAAQ